MSKKKIQYWGIKRAQFLKAGGTLACDVCHEPYDAKVMWMRGTDPEGPAEGDKIMCIDCLDRQHIVLKRGGEVAGMRLDGEVHGPKGMSPKVSLRTITSFDGFYKHILSEATE